MAEPSLDCQEIYKANQLCVALSEMMLLIGSTLDPDEIMRHIVFLSAKAIGCESARIAIREGNHWVLRYLYNLPETLKESSYTDEQLPHASLAMITKKPVAIEDAYTDNRTNIGVMKELGIRSVLVIPLLIKERVIGALFFNYHSQTIEFDKIEIDYAEKLSLAVAIALQNASHHQEQKRVNDELEKAKRLSDALNHIKTSIYSSLDTDQIMKNVLEDATLAVGAETAMIFSKEDDGWCVRYVNKLSQSLVGHCFSDDDVRHTAITAETREPLVITDARNDNRVNHRFIDMLQVRSLLDFPLLIKREVIGDLVFHYHSNVTEFTTPQINFVKSLQSSISLALENARLFEALKESDFRLKEAERIGKFGYFHFDRRTGKFTWSDGLFSIFGRDRSLGEPNLEELFHHYCTDPKCASIREQVAREEEGDFEVSIRRGEENLQLRILVHSVKDQAGSTIARLGSVLDVTDLKQAEKAVRQSDLFKQAILDCLPSHIAVINDAGEILNVNRPWLNFASENGQPDAKRVGVGANYLTICREAAKTDDYLAKEALEGIEAVLTGKLPLFSLEYPCFSPDEGRWFLMTVAPYTDDFRGAVISHIDISGRKRAEEELRQSKELSDATKSKLEAVINSMTDGLVVSDVNGNLQEFNPTALKLHGFATLEEAQQNLAHYTELFEIHDMEDKPLSLERWPISRALSGDFFTNFEIKVINRQTGHWFIGDYSGGPIRYESGKILYGLVTIRDVTEQKKAQQALLESETNYRTIFDSASDAIFIHDADTGKILDVNRKMLELYKYSREEAVYTTVMDLSGASDVTEDKVLSLIHSANSDHPMMFDWLGKDREGRLFWVEVSLKKVILQGKDRVLAIVRDISARKNAEENLKKALDQVNRSNRELEQFAYVASHDLKEPLRMISGYVLLLAKKYGGQLDERADTFIQYAVDGVKRMERLIEGLLNYSRISSTKPTDVDTGATFNDACANLAKVMDETQAEVSCENLPTICGDKTQMLQLFQNLISNALKYRRPDVKPQIQVSAQHAGKEWIFSVRDNGIGIEKNDHEKVFQIFSRLHTQEEIPGTGIGLAACKKIVEQNHGRIWLESSPGEGTTVFFTVPIHHQTNSIGGSHG